MQYEELKAIARSDATREVASGDWERTSVALVRLALHDPDPEWLQGYILPFTKHEHSWVRGVAAISIGHVARLHGRVDVERCKAAILPLLDSPETVGQAEDALDDIEMFVLRRAGPGE